MLIPPLILLNAFVVMVMFSIGLRVRGGELLDVLRGRTILIRALVANCVLIPAIGFLLVSIFPLTRDAKVGLLLLAAIPSTPIAMQFTSRKPLGLRSRDHSRAFPGWRSHDTLGGSGIS